jgi:hypothetical protein
MGFHISTKHHFSSKSKPLKFLSPQATKYLADLPAVRIFAKHSSQQAEGS